MSKHLNLIIVGFLLFALAGSNQISAVPGGGKDFSITKLRVDIATGDIYALVENSSTVPFTGDVYFGIWFNGQMKRPVKRKVIFTNNRQFEINLCNHSHLKTMLGKGKLKVKADVNNQHVEINENNNLIKRTLNFVEITRITLSYVAPNLKAWLRKGHIQKYTFTAKFIVHGRGITSIKYLRLYKRYLSHGGTGKTLLSSGIKGPYSVNVNLGIGKYGTEIVEEKWNKIVSFDVKAKNREVHERTYKVRAENPNYKESNLVSTKIGYLK